MYKDPNEYFRNNPPYVTPDEYYRKYEAAIIKHHSGDLYRWYDSYPFDWTLIFTPIERYAWDMIRSIGRIVLYPQYPVLSYRLDFANPYLKIALECDGKEFHHIEKDMVRDARLWAEGWRVFRVTGAELYRHIELQGEGFDGEEDRETYQSSDICRQFYLNTAEGVIEAIRMYYFHPGQFEEQYSAIQNNMRQTLELHRLADFPI